MTVHHALGIDIGTTRTKAVVVEIRTSPTGDAVLEVAQAGTATGSTAEGLLGAALQVVREVLSRTGVSPEAVGLASMAETGVPLDAAGAPLTDLLRWDGHRAADEAAALATLHGRGDLFRATGVRPSAKVPLATWAWLAGRHPDLAAAMAGWAGAADLVALALTGELVTDHTLAGRTMAYRLPPRGGDLSTSFDDALLSTVGLRPEQLPRVAGPTEIAGHVRGTARGLGLFWADAGRAFVEAGIAPGTPVVIAGHDHAVGAWAAGVRTAGDRADSVGTAEVVLTVLPDLPAAVPDLDGVAAAGMSWVRTVSGRRDAVLAGSSSAGAMVGWLLERADPPRSVAELFAEAREDLDADPAPTGVVVLPYLSGRQSPAPDLEARVTVSGGGANGDGVSGGGANGGGANGDGVSGPRLTRAVVEGVCLQARWMLTEQAALTERAMLAGAAAAGGSTAGRAGPVRPLTVLGGPAVADPVWAEIKGQVAAEPLRRVTAQEPVGAGAALLAATRAGLLGDDVQALLSADRVARGAAPCLPVIEDPARTAGSYDRMYEQFVTTALAAPRGGGVSCAQAPRTGRRSRS